MSAGRQLASLVLNQRPSPASAEYYRASSITVRTPKPLPLEIDGGSVSQKKVELTSEGIVYAFTLVAQGITMLLPRTYDNQLFQNPAQIDALPGRIFALQVGGAQLNGHADNHAEKSSRAGKAGKAGKAARNKALRHVMKIVAVGPATLTAASARSGRVYSIQLQAGSQIENAEGASLSWAEVGPQLAAGDIVRVKGKRDRERNTIAAKRIILMGPAHTLVAQ
jgi:hypothetical protein